jgi:hypothetical protein
VGGRGKRRWDYLFGPQVIVRRLVDPDRGEQHPFHAPLLAFLLEAIAVAQIHALLIDEITAIMTVQPKPLPY